MEDSLWLTLFYIIRDVFAVLGLLWFIIAKVPSMIDEKSEKPTEQGGFVVKIEFDEENFTRILALQHVRGLSTEDAFKFTLLVGANIAEKSAGGYDIFLADRYKRPQTVADFQLVKFVYPPQRPS